MWQIPTTYSCGFPEWCRAFRRKIIVVYFGHAIMSSSCLEAMSCLLRAARAGLLLTSRADETANPSAWAQWKKGCEGHGLEKQRHCRGTDLVRTQKFKGGEIHDTSGRPLNIRVHAVALGGTCWMTSPSRGLQPPAWAASVLRPRPSASRTNAAGSAPELGRSQTPLYAQDNTACSSAEPT